MPALVVGTELAITSLFYPKFRKLIPAGKQKLLQIPILSRLSRYVNRRGNFRFWLCVRSVRREINVSFSFTKSLPAQVYHIPEVFATSWAIR